MEGSRSLLITDRHFIIIRLLISHQQTPFLGCCLCRCFLVLCRYRAVFHRILYANAKRVGIVNTQSCQSQINPKQEYIQSKAFSLIMNHKRSTPPHKAPAWLASSCHSYSAQHHLQSQHGRYSSVHPSFFHIRYQPDTTSPQCQGHWSPCMPCWELSRYHPSCPRRSLHVPRH